MHKTSCCWPAESDCLHACQGGPVLAALHRAQDLQGGGVVEPPVAAALVGEGGHAEGLHGGRLHEAVAAQVPLAPARTRRAVLPAAG